MLPGLHIPFYAGRTVDGEKVHDRSAIIEATKNNKEIAKDIISFIHQPVLKKWDDGMSFCDQVIECAYKGGEETHEFYGYYSDYDWVLFCSLFGTMMDLPIGFPMYCNDLQQTKVDKLKRFMNDGDSSVGTSNQLPLDKQLEILKTLPGYPKQNNEHNALADAKWNYELYKFLTGK